MRKVTFIALIFLLSNTPSFAAQYGLGVELSEFTTLYFPIRTERFMFEPFLSYYENDDEADFNPEEANTFGIGIFGLSPMTENISLYYGGRLASRNYENSDSIGTYEAKSTIIAPTLGAAYSPVPNFSIAIEHRINFVSGTQDIADFFPTPAISERDVDNTSSETGVIGRIFF